MTPERWRKIEDVFQAVIDLALEERSKFLRENYADDADLVAEVERLIANYEEAGDFIESPVWTDSFILGSSMQNKIRNSISEEVAAEDGSLIGRRLGVYRLTKELGRGGMGAVYLAERADGEFRQRVALKVIKRGMDTDFIVRRFRNERQILATLNHPNIARLLDGGTTGDGLPFFVMEYIEGKPLYRYSDAKRLNIEERLRLFRRICGAVEYAHQSLIIHRDIKPSNILVTRDGTPKLLDFGIAKILDPDLATDSIDPTATAMRMMTPEYASPEQVRGEPVTKASDIYSLGVLLYELLTGHRPYRLKNRALHEIARVICEEEPESLRASLTRADNLVPTNGGDEPTTLEFIFENRNSSRESLRRELSGDLEKIVRKALRKEPSERYQSAAELSQDILRYLENRPVLAESFYTPAKTVRASLQTSPDEISIAVLPFKLLRAPGSDETGDEYLRIGLADALITRLSNVRRFLVRPTSSILPYGDRAVEPIAAGEELGVNYVIEGNLRSVGSKLRVTVQLLSIFEGAARWAGKFDEEFTDVLSLEDLISEKIAEAILPQLSGDEREKLKKRGTNSREAFEHYLRGRHHWNTFTEEGFAKAIVAYYQAVAYDPDYATAYAGIADYYNWLAIFGVLPSQECFRSAIEAAKQAIELDETLAEAHAALGFALHGGNFDWAESEVHFQRALELNPNSSLTHVWYSIKLTTEGRFVESIRYATRAVELDPNTPFNLHNLGWCLYFARQFDKSLQQYRRTAEIFPDYFLAHYGLAWVLRYIGQYDEAVREAQLAQELSDDSVFSLLTRGQTFAAAGMRAEAGQILERLDEIGRNRFVSPYHVALVYAFLGENEMAFEFLEKSSEISEAWLVWLGVEPAFDKLRSDVRFQQIVEKTNNPLLRRPAETERSAPSIAVLPFKLMSTDEELDSEDKFLGVGLADALITRLSNIRRFTVRPTSSVLPFGAGANPFEAGRDLNVDCLVDGSIRRVGDLLRVTVQLLDIKNGATCWARRFDEKTADVLTLEDVISEQIANGLVSRLSGEEQEQISKRGTNNPEAYESYLRGRYFWNQFTPESLPKAFAAFQKATALDPGYALAYVGLADFYIWATIYGIIPALTGLPKAEAALHRALEIDDKLPEAYAALGLIAHNYWNWAEAEKLLKYSMELNPNFPLAHEWYAAQLVGTGRFEDGVREVKRAEALDPLSTRSMTLTAWTLYQSRRYTESVAKARQIINLEENNPQGYMQLGINLVQIGRADEAVEALKKSARLMGDSALPNCELCFALVAAGRADEARAILRKARKEAESGYVKPYFLALMYVALDQRDQAFRHLEEAFDEKDPWLLWFGTDPKLDPLRSDPRFIELFARTKNPLAEKRPAARKSAVADGEKTIAVLPLAILQSGDTDDTGEDFLGLGLADALITRLSSVKRLVVRPTSSILNFNRGLIDPFEAAGELDVEYILSGHAKRAGGRLRVSIQLLDVARRKAVWAGRFDEKFTDVLALEDSISGQIAGALVPHLTEEDRRQLAKRGTNNVSAYETYLRGRYFWNKFTDEYLLKAVEYFQEAIRLDPNYALPHVGIADFYVWTAIFGVMPSHECFPKAKAAALRALELDDSLGESYATLAFTTLVYEWNWPEAERLVKRALELSPNHPFAHECYSNLLCAQGRFDEAVREIERAEELDPISPRAMLMSAWTFYNARRFPEAVAKAVKGLEMEKTPHGLLHYGNALTETSQTEEAVESLMESCRLWGASKMPHYMLCYALVAAGRRDEAQKLLDELLDAARDHYVKPYFLAMACAALGRIDAAFEWFEKALESQDEWMLWFATEPKLDVLRGDPRYAGILRRTNNPAAQPAARAPSRQAPGREKSIAVLPFRVLNTEPGTKGDSDFLGIGLADALINRLSSVKRLVVRPTSSVLRFSDGAADPFAAAREVDVDFVIDGHVKRARDRIRVSIQLLKISEQKAVWAKSFNEKFRDVLELEDVISEQIAEALLPQITEDEKRNLSKRPTDSPEAFEAYLRGRYYFNQFTEDGFARALEWYNRAIELAPDYALAYAGIADYYNLLGVYNVMPFVDASAKAKEAALRAITLDAGLAEGHAALGFATMMRDLDWKATERNLTRAIELNPNYVTGRLWYCYYLGFRGDWDGAFKQIRRALELDPLTPIVAQTLNWTLYHSRRFDEAVAETEKLIEKEPGYGLSHVFLSSVMSRLGRHDDAKRLAHRAIELLGRGPYSLMWLASAYAAAGEREEALRLLAEIDELKKSRYTSPYLTAMVYANLGEKELAFEYLDEAQQTRDGRILWLGIDPQFDSLRGDPRFNRLLLKIESPLAVQPERKSAAQENSIAVLPFRLYGTETEYEFLGIGLADAMIRQLSHVQRFVVRPTSSIVRYNAAEADPFVAGGELGVGFILDGHLQKAGNRLRLSVQLLDVVKRTTVWAQAFDEQFTDVFAIQDSISLKVSESLIPKLSGWERRELKKHGTSNIEAYEAYLRGRYQLNHFTANNFIKAVENFRHATELDPGYALAYVGLAESYFCMAAFGGSDPAECSARLRHAALQAIELDRTVGEAYTVLGIAELHDFNTNEAENLILRGLGFNPNQGTGCIWYSVLLMGKGDYEQALVQARRAVELDPGTAFNRYHYAWILYHTRHLADAESEAVKAAERNPAFSHGLSITGWIYRHLGRNDEAIRYGERAVEIARDTPWANLSLAATYAQAGRTAEARAILQKFEDRAQTDAVSPYNRAIAYLHLGERDKALEMFEEAVRIKEIWVIWLGSEPQLDSLRDDPRFTRLLEKTRNPV